MDATRGQPAVKPMLHILDALLHSARAEGNCEHMLNVGSMPPVRQSSRAEVGTRTIPLLNSTARDAWRQPEAASGPDHPSVTPCSPPSRTLRAASGGGPRGPSLTASARAVTRLRQVGTKKRSSGRTKKLTETKRKLPAQVWISQSLARSDLRDSDCFLSVKPPLVVHVQTIPDSSEASVAFASPKYLLL
jgi:hypothetical protein